MNGATLEAPPRSLPQRQSVRLVTDAATETGEHDELAEFTPSSGDFGEPVPQLAQRTYRPLEHSGRACEKPVWAFVMEARNHLVHLRDFVSTEDELGYPGDTTTSTAPWPALWQQPKQTVDIQRGVFAFNYDRKVLFTVEMPIAEGGLPRWKPKIVLQDDSIELDNE